MKLGEQLDELRRNILRDHSDIVAGDSDALWSDETLLRYIGEAERRFARQTMLLRDATTPRYCQLTLREGKRDYPLPPEVFGVMSARLAGQDGDLRRSGRTLVEMFVPSPLSFIDPTSFNDLPPGSPLAYYTDETLVYAQQAIVTVSIYPLPDSVAAGQIINMRVLRVPVDEYSVEDLDRDSELPRDYQIDVLEWAAYRAQRNNDADAGETTSADAHRTAFESSIKEATRETKRRMLVPTGLRYGTLGFSWER